MAAKVGRAGLRAGLLSKCVSQTFSFGNSHNTPNSVDRQRCTRELACQLSTNDTASASGTVLVPSSISNALQIQTISDIALQPNPSAPAAHQTA